MKTLKLTLLAVVLSSISFLQPAQAYRNFSAAYFSVGTHFIYLDALNNHLETNGITTFQKNKVSLGGGMHYTWGSFLFGFSGYGLASQTARIAVGGSSYDASFSGGMGFVNMGWVMLRSSRLNVYPLIGIGTGAIGVDFKEVAAHTFDSVLADPKKSSNLTTGGFMLDLGLGVDYIWGSQDEDGAIGGFVFGLRAGYTLTPFGSGWSLDGEDITGGPAQAINGPYVRLSIGFGGRPSDLMSKTQKIKDANVTL